MGRAPCCAKEGLHRGPWTPREDTLLVRYIEAHGEGHWRSLPKKAGLLRCGKSCRLRWMNYLRPDIKRGNITPDEDDLIIRMHALLGNRWSLIAKRLPGRTDNEIKNYWNTHLSKRLRSQGTDPNTHQKLSQPLQDVKRSKKNSKKNNNNKASTGGKNQKSKSQPGEEPLKTKVYLPKPVRVRSWLLPRNDSFESTTVTESGSSSQDKTGGFVAPMTWYSSNTNHDNGVGFFIGEEGQQHLVNDAEFECQSQLPSATDNTLEKLYEEYLQLLRTEDDQVQLDSFAESLLA